MLGGRDEYRCDYPHGCSREYDQKRDARCVVMHENKPLFLCEEHATAVAKLGAPIHTWEEVQKWEEKPKKEADEKEVNDRLVMFARNVSPLK